MFPQLTPFGRVFKASGYTLFNTRKVQDIDQQKQSTLSLSDLPPVSAMVMASTSMAAKANDSTSSKTSTDFPQQLSLFYAGRISDNVGAFVQLTYDDQSGSFGIDNTDIRFADVANVDGHNVIYGISLNNNPTVQDLWNSVPAWEQPFIASPALQGPAAGSQIEGAMAQNVAGLSAYTLVDESLYAEVGVYRSALQGASVANNGDANNQIISGVAPYWRVAYEKDWGKNSWEFGVVGLYAALQNPTTPAGAAINGPLQNAPTDRFLDTGLDTQYQYIDDHDQVTVTSSWVHENQDLNASYAAGFASMSSNSVDTFNLNGSYFWLRKVGGSLGFTSVSSSNDPLYFGTPVGNSNSSWGTVEVNYLPWLNVKLGLQYTAFFKFNGASSNYDGAGRNASDNNMLFGYLWIAY
ncbi:MAG: cytochrome C [Alphaproteobacteria bacterium]|nr:cytochrome C [Alphaproteobacteria bacterium]